MKRLTYTGPAGTRHMGSDDGLDVERVFELGVPLEISDADAGRILDGPHADEFTTTPASSGDDDEED